MAVATAGSVPPMHGGEAGKNACDNAGGRRALNSTEPVPPDAGQGGLRGRETALPPAGGGVPPTWPQHHPRGTRSCDKRRPEHSVGWRWWWAGEQGTHPDSQSRSLAGSRRRAGRGGVRRCPGGAERRQAGRRHSTRGPVSPRARQPEAACRGDVGRQLACPTGELLQHPTRQVGSRHATHATATRHDRHTAPARHVDRRVTREAAALPSTRAARAPGWLAAGRIRSKTRSRFTRRPRWGGGLKASLEAHARAPRCTARSTRAGRCAGCWRP